MKLQRGMRGKLGDFLNISGSFDVTMSIQGSGVYDFSCFGLDGQGRLSDDRYMVFYNQKNSPMAEVIYSQAPGGINFNIRLDKLPETINKLVFTATIDGAGTMAMIGSHSFEVRQNGVPVLSMTLTGADFKKETAIITAEIYRKDGIWRYAAVGSGFNGGLGDLLRYFGGEEVSPAQQPAAAPVQPVYTQPAAPAPKPLQQPPSQPAPVSSPFSQPTPAQVPQGSGGFVLKPTSVSDFSGTAKAGPVQGGSVKPVQQSPQPSVQTRPPVQQPEKISLKKGQKVSLSKAGSAPIIVENGWTAKGKDYDLKALVRYRSGKLIYIGAANSDELLTTPEGAVHHCGDVKAPGELEHIEIKWHPDIASVAVSSYSALENGTGSFNRYGVFVRIRNGQQVIEIPAADTSANDRSYTLCFGEIVYSSEKDRFDVIALEMYSSPNSERRIGYQGAIVKMDIGPEGRKKS
ncbi:MAG: TerD family protein [Ruminococcus sp.]|nr:TerD family protein [Ruminococcus sp.]